MRVTPENVLQHELTGLKMHVVESTDPTIVCKKGIIHGESKNMIHFSIGLKQLSVQKMGSVLDLTLPDDSKVRIKGSLLQGRPEDRMKKRFNRSW